MRVIPMCENKKRGCCYCLDSIKQHVGYVVRTTCPHAECPYKVLDKYETYEDFMASEDSRILVEEFFQTIADCYTLASVRKKATYNNSDGDFKMSL